MAILTMIATAAMIILAVKYGLLRGIDQVANAMNWTAKARGQVTGFATSVPELVCLVAAGGLAAAHRHCVPGFPPSGPPDHLGERGLAFTGHG